MVIITAILGIFAWIYQKTWERQAQRLATYQEIMDGISAFTINSFDKNGIEKNISLIRRLWLFAPDHVVKKAEAFLDAVEQSKDAKDDKLAEWIIAMRQDTSFWAVLVPRFFQTKLKKTDFRLRSSNSNCQINGS
jgi:hypothetical protein